jgi:hypothetical protein
MPLNQLLEKLAVVAAEGVLLFILSRALFAWVLQALASRHPHRRGGWLVQVVRLPGNLIHEISHALGFVLCGYRVRRLIPCIFDSAGAGACVPGKPWSPLAVPWLATGLAALAPLLVGSCVLYGVARWMHLPLGDQTLSALAPARSVLQSLYHGLLGLDYRSGRTWLFLYLAFTIGAELAPSGTDVRLGLPALLAGAALTLAVLLGVYQLAPSAPLRIVVVREVAQGLAWLARIFSCALLTTLTVLALTLVPAALVRTARER